MTYHKVIKSLLLSCLFAFSYDALAYNDGTWTYDLTSGDAGTVIVTGRVSYPYPAVINIPSTIDGISVTEVGSYAFFNDGITGVRLPDSLIGIGSYAFGLNKIAALNLSDVSSLRWFGDGAFSDNTLYKLTIPDSVKNIGSLAFDGNQIANVFFEGDRPRFGSLPFIRNSDNAKVVYCVDKKGNLEGDNYPDNWPGEGLVFNAGYDGKTVSPIADCDLDGVLGADDIYPRISLMGRLDTDGDGQPDDCDSDCELSGMEADQDDDGDGVLDVNDGYPLNSLGGLPDNDNDGIPNDCDYNCRFLTGMKEDPDDDNDGVADTDDAFPLDGTESADTDADGIGDNADLFPNNPAEMSDSDGDGVGDNKDAFPNDSSETTDSDGDAIGDNADAFPLNASESVDTDGDGIGNNSDLDDDDDGFTDEEELADGTDPLNAFSCKSGCFSFDVDENLEAQPLTDGLLVIRHLFGFSGDSLTSGAVSSDASRDSSDTIASYLTDADSQLDIDGDGESKPLTDGLLLIRYLFGFSGDSLVSGAIGAGAPRDTAEAVEAYIKERVPAD